MLLIFDPLALELGQIWDALYLKGEQVKQRKMDILKGVLPRPGCGLPTLGTSLFICSVLPVSSWDGYLSYPPLPAFVFGGNLPGPQGENQQ